MALATYNDLKDSISNWLHRSDLSSYLDDLITLGEKRIHRDTRSRDMLADLAQTVSTAGTASVPSDFIELDYAYVSTKVPMDQRLPEQVLAEFPNRSQGTAEVIAVDGGEFIFGPVPAAGTVILGKYYKVPGTLSSAVYDLFTNNPDLFLWAALAESAPLLKNDARIGVWEGKYASTLDQVNTVHKRARTGSGMRVTLR